jgi:aspartate racemase
VLLDEQKLKTNVLGIIGGAGVAASNELMSRIEEYLTYNGAYRDAHHPQIILYNATQVPSRSMYLEGRGESFVPGYVEVVKKFELIGVTLVAMCCNTAHNNIKDIQDSTNLKIINLIECTFSYLEKLGGNYSKVGIMASDGTCNAKLFDFYAPKGLELIYPDEENQRKITQGICNIKKAYHKLLPINDKERPYLLFMDAAQSLFNAGAEIIILGCTEIPLDFTQDGLPDFPVIDTIEVLKYECLDHFMKD